MYRPFAMALVTLSTLLTGCSTPALQSLCESGSLTQDPGLAGVWETDDPTVTRVAVTEQPDGRYAGVLTINRDSELHAALGLEISLTRIGDDSYADLFLAKSERERLASRYGLLALPVHQFLMIRRDGDSLRVWSFNPDWMKKASADRDFACGAVSLAGLDVIVVTGDSGALRSFVERHAGDAGALNQPMLFRRVGKTSPGPAR